jgi:hypothetical protein
LKGLPPKEENKYVVEQPDQQCLQCLAIWERHPNVLEFKSGDCVEGMEVEEVDMASLCAISPDSPLRTLARLGLLVV